MCYKHGLEETYAMQYRLSQGQEGASSYGKTEASKKKINEWKMFAWWPDDIYEYTAWFVKHILK